MVIIIFHLSGYVNQIKTPWVCFSGKIISFTALSFPVIKYLLHMSFVLWVYNSSTLIWNIWQHCLNEVVENKNTLINFCDKRGKYGKNQLPWWPYLSQKIFLLMRKYKQAWSCDYLPINANSKWEGGGGGVKLASGNFLSLILKFYLVIFFLPLLLKFVVLSIFVSCGHKKKKKKV